VKQLSLLVVLKGKGRRCVVAVDRNGRTFVVVQGGKEEDCLKFCRDMEESSFLVLLINSFNSP